MTETNSLWKYGLVAVALFVSPALGQADEPAGECTGYCAYKKQKDAEEDALWADYQKEPQKYRAICSKPYDREYADLCQQWRMAEMARKQVKWTRAQFWATVFEIVALLGALGLSAYAAIISVRAARGADKTAHRQLRAYMGHMSAHFENAPIPGANAFGFQNGSVKYFEINSGRTPALKTEMYINIVSLQPGQVPPVPDDSLCRRMDLVQIVHPNQNFGSIVGPQTIRDSFFLYGCVNYEDIFAAKWRRRFAFVHDASKRVGFEERWTAYPTHNDEEALTPPLKPSGFRRYLSGFRFQKIANG